MFLFMLLSGLLMSFALFFSKKSYQDREKLSPFECGFNPFKKARTSFSLRFFLVTILFLIFDLEVVVLLPLGLILSGAFSLILVASASLIVFILIFGLLNEWLQGALDWVD